ncbi:hypothetical protein DI487_01065 [Flavobacterium sediminis]|uniref:DUF306 domain-containing protein n=1 Tax=Flavobacterium sediminis TaxID=2201181 RepID=A0A2U8QR64_9FLAO|nr:META domain-containing protein [Flavobacterium sediminis]AWM12599.1 hypothetical protein DI487_01065 [Flavobacterium sediminis]
MKKISVLFFFILFLSCKSSKDTNLSAQENLSKAQTTPENMEFMTDYFSGNGTEPFWSIRFSTKNILFLSLSDTIAIPYTAPKVSKNTSIYSFKDKMLSFKVTLTDENCVNQMSGKEYPNSVTIEYQKNGEPKQSLNGCGRYIIDYKLLGTWKLQKMNDQILTEADFDNFPQLEIKNDENYFYGSTGCNRMNGAMLYENEKLSFKNIITTRKMCLKSAENETTFLTLLQQVDEYSISDATLNLKSNGKTILSFTKS